MADHNELKRLTTRKAEIEANIRAYHEDASRIGSKIGKEQQELRTINREIEKIKRKQQSLIITEHAILRYLERVDGLDLEAIKKKILPQDVQDVAKALGNGVYPVGTSHRLKVTNGVVATVETKDKQGN